MGNAYNTQTLKVKSKMASARMKAHVSKMENALVKSKRAVAQLMAEEKIQSARIKVEGILREEDLVRVYEWLQMMCDLIHQRVRQIEGAKKTCPEDLLESICTILYCAKRVDIPELIEVGGQFKAKWGDNWFNSNIENKSGRVSKQIIEKLAPHPPKRTVVDAKLKEIATKYDLEWEPGDEVNDEDMPAIVGHRNEYTVEFTSKPFGMEWTATEDGANLWTSNVTPMSQAARLGVVPGSMLIALNGIDIQNLGAPSIHDKAASLGLPLRVTFRKPEQLEAPKNKKDFKIREDVVNNCVKQLRAPASLDMSDEQRNAMCKKLGANFAEIASALFLANYTEEYQRQQQQQQQQQQAMMYQQPAQIIMQPQQPMYPPQAQGQPPMQYVPVQPMQPQQPMYPSPQAQQPMQPMQPMDGYAQPPVYGSPQAYSNPPPQAYSKPPAPEPYNTPDQPPMEQPPPQEPPSGVQPGSGGGGDLADLESRFAALKNGL
eukprot:CAMPEP_0202692996 /NCGR_PEP_ID=MMETSP1385-20130828/7228_1 /ASSEMBLY_ACC=CAM_ASM_000861 /TAXON_ID=933848 /ORGANISM="Elphidium margaritaceum" /LENGTH=487 /DNA_ID=CAMNT_0049348615 /DNA_START=29 /DNA_END=1492 /DNA_ORIENTATION=+